MKMNREKKHSMISSNWSAKWICLHVMISLPFMDDRSLGKKSPHSPILKAKLPTALATPDWLYWRWCWECGGAPYAYTDKCQDGDSPMVDHQCGERRHEI